VTSAPQSRNHGRARANQRRALNGRAPKPTPDQVRPLEENRNPLAPPGREDLDIKPQQQIFADVVFRFHAAIVRSEMSRPLDRRLHTQGRPSILRSESLLLGILLAIHLYGSATRTSITRALASISPDQRWEFGLYDCDGRPPSYRTVEKQTRRLENLLGQKLFDDGDHQLDWRWFWKHLHIATVPEHDRDSLKAIALDDSSIETSAVTQYFGEGDGPSDEYSEYQRLLGAGVDAPEPASIAPAVRASTDRPSRVGDLGPDGRLIVSADVDARRGWHTGVGKRNGHVMTGYQLHAGVGVRSYGFRGRFDDDPVKLLSPRPVRYVHALELVPAGYHRGKAGLRAIQDAAVRLPALHDVIADRGYTMVRPEWFHRPLHKAGFNLTTDFSKAQLARTDIVISSDGSTSVIRQAGSFFHKAMPDKLLDTSPMGFGKEKAERFAESRTALVSLYAYSPNGRDRTGRRRLRSPFFSGRAVNPEINPASTRWNKPFVPSPAGLTDDPQTVSFDLEAFDYAQEVPWGTKHWKKSYNRRVQIETVFSRLEKIGLSKDGFIRALGLDANTLASYMTVAVYNLRITLGIEEPDGDDEDDEDEEVGDDGEAGDERGDDPEAGPASVTAVSHDSSRAPPA